MGLITGLVTLPLAPVRGVVRLAEFLQEQAEQELYDPIRLRQRLEDVADARAAGEISEEEAAELEEELLTLLMNPPVGRR
ncbi:gas vesicle protein GvpG [Thermomonospora umbrina]|uniref:Gas vesicle protein GvpG n=1 Tax=Thermomonospora umbrina TaxID=111806 RepID=A0A3D9SVU2_9ACTN|nr:gas vesicle protein GvpG [Thermomonospora umbrina]REE95781.1 gas vesicle protein GvpG [Thermomonospora umbrina]